MGRSVRLALGVITAAILSQHVAERHLGAATALALAMVLLLREMRVPIGRSALPVAIGAALLLLRLGMLPAAGPMLDQPPDGSGPWRFMIEATGSPRDGSQTATLITTETGSPPFRVAATLPRYPVVIPGDVITVDGAIRPRPESSYGSYLLRIGAVGTLDSRSLTVEPASDDLLHRLEILRRGAGDALAMVLPEPEAGLAAGILIGLRDRVDRDLAAAFTAAGVSHVVAISGWNIAIVAAAIAALTGRLGRRRRSVVTIIAIVAYVAFAGASASVVRAGLMAGVVLLARESGRAGRAAAALGWAVTVLLLIDPGLVTDAGFQLSSLATAGLIVWASPLTGWLEGRAAGRLPGWLAENIGVSLAAQAATLPIILVSFGRLAVLSPIVNLVVVPLVAPAMAVGLIALGAGALVAAGAPPLVGALLAAPGWVILRILVTTVQVSAGLPFATVGLAPPFDLIGGLAVAAALAVAVWWQRTRPAPASAALRAGASGTAGGDAKGRGAAPALSGLRSASRASVIALMIAATVAGGVVAARPSAAPRVTILDVGQGDAILVEGSRGARLLVDGGPDPDRLLVALDRRIPAWDRRIDAVILSHPHEDHVAGLALLLERYRVATVFEPGMIGPGPGYAAWLRDLARPGAPTRRSLAAGDRLKVDEIDLHVLWPIRGRVPSEPPDGGTGINNVSVVMLGSVGPRRFLLMGDVEEEIDPSIISEGLPHVDLLKVAHHGSRTATTEAFIDATRPTVAVASAGAGNPYGHPAKSTIERLTASGARVLRTDEDGTVAVSFEPDGMTTRLEGARAISAGPTGVPTTGALAAVIATQTPTFLCAIPVTGLLPIPVPPSAAVTAAAPDPGGEAMTGWARRVGYHRPDGNASTDRACLPDPTRLLLGRRRPVDGPGRRPLRGRTRSGDRWPDGALADAWRSERSEWAGRRAHGPPGDAGHVRRRDTGRREQPRQSRAQDGGSGRLPVGDDPHRTR